MLSRLQSSKEYLGKITPCLIHPSVNLKYSNVGSGNIIYENVKVATGVRIGLFNIIYPDSYIGHESK